ncbi:hypothetical protein TSMEX_002589 [Taenia solium]|eukprot:TsM_001116300 transcript=TsM_001116300 gene=TsM_001116300
MQAECRCDVAVEDGVMGPSEIELVAVRHSLLMVSWRVAGEQDAGNTVFAYVMGMEEEKHCASTKEHQCPIYGLKPFVTYTVCVQNCIQGQALMKAASPLTKGAQLVSSDVLELATVFTTAQYTCSDAICKGTTIGMEGEKYCLVVLTMRHVCERAVIIHCPRGTSTVVEGVAWKHVWLAMHVGRKD